ncbi:MAG TPA: 5-formyltetrahydrofolate cyclo-ligase [Desulfobacteraceae bacterium]|nr:5-formyltetrahydrofolate cyclo-ligase [Deltaproteobacteria bacterium]HDI59105.1 5-formyltetrahydrofolate cyclo-ligase [Desulfobacteraceae bacterium]
MEDQHTTKQELRQQIISVLENLSEAERAERTQAIEARLFEFANFLEARIVMMYMPGPGEVDTRAMIQKALQYNKIVVLPSFAPGNKNIALLKIDDLGSQLIEGPSGIAQPDPKRCKQVPLDVVDIAILPAIGLDEKGGRLGGGLEVYDLLMPRLAPTTRKVALGFEEQIVPQIHMESQDRFVDIIITNQRTIYKI